MNRVIKFRAWHEEDRRMVPVETLHMDNEGVLKSQIIYSGPVMQFTDLLDKNGKEIYEGDVVRIPDDYEVYGQYAGDTREVYFHFGAFRLKPKWDKSQLGNHFHDVNESLEVIGNIYENPELLSV